MGPPYLIAFTVYRLCRSSAEDRCGTTNGTWQMALWATMAQPQILIAAKKEDMVSGLFFYYLISPLIFRLKVAF